MNENFVIAMAIMAFVAYGYRVTGLVIGTRLSRTGRWRRFLDVLPACAIGAVLGPALITMTWTQSCGLAVAACAYFLTSRFLVALALGAAVLMSEQWIMQVVS